MATILAHIKIREGHEARFEEIAREMYESSHAHETGVREYQYWRGAEPRSYYTLLSFDDYHAFMTHQTSPHHEDASPDLRTAFESIKLEWVDPVGGASPLPATEHQPAADDASDLAKQYTKTYAAAVQSWWEPLRH